MYKAVNENIAQIAGRHLRRHRHDAPVLGADRRRTAEPEDRRRSSPSTRAAGQNTSADKCTVYDCNINTTSAREQVGSSFKPYVLSTAVSQGMDVQNSILNSSDVPLHPGLTPSRAVLAGDFGPVYVRAGPATNTAAPTRAPSRSRTTAARPSATRSGRRGTTCGDDVQNALAQSSNTAFTDLAHRAGTARRHSDGENFGVDIPPSRRLGPDQRPPPGPGGRSRRAPR